MDNSRSNAALPVFKGDILLCEDNEINQHFIKRQLERVCLSVTAAADGREGVDAVKAREGQKQFDLIFMDIQMPVMDGLEAAQLIAGMGVKTPIVALTSNVTPEDKKVYAEHGMKTVLCKPFKPEELYECLGGILGGGTNEEESKRDKLFSGFVRRNQNTYSEIRQALEAGDLKQAYKLAHNLRGMAGLMGKKELQEAAQIVENVLSGEGASPPGEAELDTLGRELKAVLTELAPYMDK